MGETSNGDLLARLTTLVTACRRADAHGEYPHVGDILWWFRDPAIEDAVWRFWPAADGSDQAVGMVDGDALLAIIHPAGRAAGLAETVRDWGVTLIVAAERAAGSAMYTVAEEAADDDLDQIAWLARAGYSRGDWYYVRYQRTLTGTLPLPVVPQGFTIRAIAGEHEVAQRAALHRDSFFPYTSASDEAATARHLQAMRLPGYRADLDLMVVAPDGALAAGCIGWLDAKNRSGLIEPLGAHPNFRRLGLARALVAEVMQRLAADGATQIYVSGNHPGDGIQSSIPAEFTSSRWVYEQLGFQLMRRIYRYSGTFPLASSVER